MLNSIFLYLGSTLCVLLGSGHLLLIQGVLREFKSQSTEKKRIITMGWIQHGFTVIFIGLLTFLITIFVGPMSLASIWVYRISAGMLFIIAILTVLTGGRTDAILIKLCPIVEIFCAILFVLGSFI